MTKDVGGGQARLGRRRFGKIVAVSALGSIASISPRANTQLSKAKVLPFDLPSKTELRSSTRRVFAQYFTPYPLSLDNNTTDHDYYALQYNSPTGENGTHAAYGGFFRDRPIPLHVSASKSWQLDNMKIEIQRASDAGLDGFIVDVLTTSGPHWDRLRLLLQAAEEVDAGFKIVPMPDGLTSDVDDPVALSDAVTSIAHSPATFRLNDGRVVVSPFFPERQGAAWWGNWISIMRTRHQTEIALLPCFLDYSRSADSFESISYGFSNWGNRNPAANAQLAAFINDAHGRGKIWMQPVSTQDVRPSQGIYDEANNSENLRVTWESAIAGADWVQTITWNDYSEGTEISPSTHIGWSLLDINSYYLTRFKTGQWPSIERDVIHLSHRVQFAAAEPTGGQTVRMALRAGSSPSRDRVEVLAFLTAPAAVEVTTGNTAHVYPAGRGMSVWSTGLKLGANGVIVRRSGKLVASVYSPYVVDASPAVQDLQYHFSSSAPQLRY